MVRSNRCHLADMGRANLFKLARRRMRWVAFTCNRIERVIRMLQVPDATTRWPLRKFVLLSQRKDRCTPRRLPIAVVGLT